MSSFDDEFGLFNEEADEGERRSTLGARKIASNETIIDEIEPEEPRKTRPVPERRSSGGMGRQGGGAGTRRYRERGPSTQDPVALQRRASALLEFLAKKLVTKPDEVTVDLFEDDEGQPVIELIVDPEDLGKVIGRSGRVAHALRTVVRATAESRISVDILDSEEAAESPDADTTD